MNLYKQNQLQHLSNDTLGGYASKVELAVQPTIIDQSTLQEQSKNNISQHVPCHHLSQKSVSRSPARLGFAHQQASFHIEDYSQAKTQLKAAHSASLSVATDFKSQSGTQNTKLAENKMHKQISIKTSHGPSQSTDRAPEDYKMKIAESREDSYRLPMSMSDPTARDAVEGSSIEQMSRDIVDWEHDKIMTFKEQQMANAAVHDILN